jgi:hypothetical protein
MSNSIFDDFLDQTFAEAQALAAQSDVLRISRLPIPGVGIFLAEFDIPYLTAAEDGTIGVAPGPIQVAIQFGPNYLREVSPLEIVQVQQHDLFHPNYRWPVLCVGTTDEANSFLAGTPLPQLLRHVFEIATYVTYATDDGLNIVAAQRLREDPSLLNLLPPPPRLVRRQLELA